MRFEIFTAQKNYNAFGYKNSLVVTLLMFGLGPLRNLDMPLHIETTKIQHVVITMTISRILPSLEEANRCEV